MRPIEIRIQNHYPQTGIEKHPLVMWKYGAGSKRQTAYEILLYQGNECLYTTGKVTSDAQNGIELPWGLGEQSGIEQFGGHNKISNAQESIGGSAEKDFLELADQTEYEFQVRVWDEDGQEYCSDKAVFVTGVSSWRGKWIGNGTAKPFMARKEFSVDCKKITASENRESASKLEAVEERGNDFNAILSLCIPGQFEVRLNGEKISPYVYEGSQTDFNKHVHYSTYDVTKFLKDGTNVLTVEVANGWYIGDDDGGKRYFYTMDKGYQPFGTCLSLLAQMRIRYTDGNQELIVSDESWEVSPSKTVLADIYGSEDMDYTREYTWQQASAVEGPKGEVIPFDYPPVVEKKCYESCRIWKVDETTFIYDFGQNMSSQFEIRIKGKRGQVVKVTPAEKLQRSADNQETANVALTENLANTGGGACEEDSECITDIDPTVPTYSLLTLSGGEDTFRQKFSVNGARWYKVEGVSESQILEFKSYFVTSSAKKSGYFHCSDERLNGIFRLIENAIDSNLNHSHTDCPTIEKLGWLEPNHLMGKAVMYLKDVDMMWSKIALDMRDAQYEEGEFDLDNGAFPHEYKAGLVPSIAPRYARFITDWREGSFWDIIPWGSSIILAAYEQYLFYGNTRVLAENYHSAKRYLQYLTEQYNDYNRLYGKSGQEKFICTGLGDWGVAQNKGRSRENVETAFYYRDLKVMAEIARILGEMSEKESCEIPGENARECGDAALTGIKEFLSDALSYEEQAEEVRRLYNEALLVVEEKGQGHLGQSARPSDSDVAHSRAYYRAYDSNEENRLTQANQAIPLYFGMVPEEAKAGVEATLVELCEGNHLVCGEVGLVYILRSLAAMNRNDIILDMITKEQHPSYLRFVEQGETTLPEFWRDDARSRNHDMMGHIMEWFFAEVAGIKQGCTCGSCGKGTGNGAAGFQTLCVAPACKDFIHSFTCEYDSIRGKIRVEYDGENLLVETPCNMDVICVNAASI